MQVKQKVDDSWQVAQHGLQTFIIGLFLLPMHISGLSFKSE
jgi:hypothetical protein